MSLSGAAILQTVLTVVGVNNGAASAVATGYQRIEGSSAMDTCRRLEARFHRSPSQVINGVRFSEVLTDVTSTRTYKETRESSCVEE